MDASSFGYVPPYRTEFTAAQIEAALQGFNDVLQSGRLVLGPHTEAFEREFAQLAGNRHAVAVNSGSTALEIIFQTIGVAGRDVLVPSNTNFATARAAVAANGRPVFYDSGLFATQRSIAERITQDTVAVVIVHIGGHISPELPALTEELASAGIELIEDAAHAHGSTLGGRQAGTFGHAAFSFFPTKVITTFEGGMVITHDESVAESARRYRDQGRDGNGDLHIVAGNSWRMTEVGAVLGLIQLQTFASARQRRHDILQHYRMHLKEVLSFPACSPRDILSGHKAIGLLPAGIDRAEVRQRVRQSNVYLAREVYAVPLHRQPVFAPFVDDGFVYEEADRFCQQHICLPLWTTITDEQVDRVIEVVLDIME